MAVDKRLRYFNGQFLQAADFIGEQDYHLDRLRSHLSQLHTPGIADGLDVDAAVGATQAVVSPGTAIDEQGRQIVLTASRSLPLGGLAGETALVLISYQEQAADPATAGSGSETRWHERPEVVAVPDDAQAPPAGTHVRLARLSIGNDGRVAAAADESVRVRAGGELGDEVTARKLSLRREGVDPTLWPALTSGAPGRLDVAGALDVSGALSVADTLSVIGAVSAPGGVDGRDVAADGANLDAHLARTDNPHGVTPAQIGALPASDYAFAQREFARMAFGSAYDDGEIQTVDVGFVPTFLLVFSGCQARIGNTGEYHGGLSVGFADLMGTINQSSTALIIDRDVSVPYVEIFGSVPLEAIYAGEVWDRTVSPVRAESLSIFVTDVSGTIVSFQFGRIPPQGGGYAQVTNFTIDMQLIFFG